MNKLITAIAAASMLFAGPALADRAGHHKSQLVGSVFEKARSEHEREARSEHWRGDNKRKEFQGSHRPARYDRDENRGHDRGRGHRGHNQDRGHRGHNQDRDHQGHDRDRNHGGYREHDKRGHDKHGYRHDYKHGYRHSGHGGHDRPYYGKRHKRYHKHYWRPSHYHYGYRWRHLPRNFVRISFGGLGLFYSDGIFYQPHDYGYVVARAPLGAVIHSLPGSAISVVFGGLNYYVAYDTYYLWDAPSRGYRVVANPGFY